MPSGKNEKEFKPRTVAVKNLYEENVRLQKLCAAHRRQIRGMQKALETYKAMEVAVEYRRAALEMAAVYVRTPKPTASPAQTETAEENGV
jgi:hypothetical protein